MSIGGFSSVRIVIYVSIVILMPYESYLAYDRYAANDDECVLCWRSLLHNLAMEEDSYHKRLCPDKTMKSDYGSSVATPSNGVEDHQKITRRIGSCYCARRYYLAVCAFLGFCLIYTMRVNLSIAILYMTRNNTNVAANETEGVTSTFDGWDSVTQGVIMGAFFYGYIISQLPGGIQSSVSVSATMRQVPVDNYVILVKEDIYRLSVI
ncbi:unnamed protein product [Soboliphyme baturini]|uniref:MFS domain-containing protein n=1 Tax=Soboliphyme baturini TaxID=241478 RepID=A0A183IZA3_9BILA|nr:unnamed protein product [Soboliphyme baturini]